ncbi:tautomerase family protein [Pigmentibacter sp. JX0631]|uniref:tautomerase family protein n=1 Tax=Pigmentibacter sp. JX0631 TaxID=2976982 RepID=UPI002468517F|nr:tautomerase family protein [Pigmentibacter sp. JX0631]WGL58748.1 tautomerase family protein [Pigmentibacter sp. JX0631]
MPHIIIKHFPSSSKEQRDKITLDIIQTISRNLNCSENVISISFEEIEKENWFKEVYKPEIIEKKNLLHKQPNY